MARTKKMQKERTKACQEEKYGDQNNNGQRRKLMRNWQKLGSQKGLGEKKLSKDVNVCKKNVMVTWTEREKKSPTLSKYHRKLSPAVTRNELTGQQSRLRRIVCVCIYVYVEKAIERERERFGENVASLKMTFEELWNILSFELDCGYILSPAPMLSLLICGRRHQKAGSRNESNWIRMPVHKEYVFKQLGSGVGLDGASGGWCNTDIGISAGGGGSRGCARNEQLGKILCARQLPPIVSSLISNVSLSFKLCLKSRSL